MRLYVKLTALAAVAAAVPAAAQVQTGVGVGVDVGAGAGVEPGRAVDGVLGTTDRVVDSADRSVNAAVRGEHRLATRADLRTGLVVRDGRGRRVGTVHSVGASSAVVVQGNRRYQVPLSSLYRTGRGLVTHMSRAQLRAEARASARARAGAGTR